MNPVKQEEKRQKLIEHLSELRFRLLISLSFISLGFVLCWSFSEEIFDIIRSPIAPYLQTKGFIFTAPLDKFLSHLKVTFLGGIIISSPAWLYQVWKFVSPGLHLNERKATLIFVSLGTVLFFLGISFVYFLIYPLTFPFLMNFGGSVDKPMITIKEFLSFFTLTTLSFGLVFELPLILSFLGFLGIISSQFLREKRKYALLLLTILSAIITPPDVMSMLLMSGPLILLYEISIVLVWFFEKKKAP